MLHMAIFGKTGVGKSKTANNIFGGGMFFASSCQGTSVTLSCQTRTASVLGRSVNVVDTPGIFDTSGAINMRSEIRKCFDMAKPGIHVVLLIARIGRSTQEDFEALVKVVNYFGDSINNHTIMLFTYYDDWKRDQGSGDSFIKYIETLPLKFREFVKTNCQNRYIPFDNTLTGKEAEEQIRQLFSKVDELLKINGNLYITYNEIVQRVEQKAIPDEIQTRISSDINECRKRKEKAEDEDIARKIQELNTLKEHITGIRDYRSSLSSESTTYDVLSTVGKIVFGAARFLLILNGYGDTGRDGFFVTPSGFGYRRTW